MTDEQRQEWEEIVSFANQEWVRRLGGPVPIFPSAAVVRAVNTELEALRIEVQELKDQQERLWNRHHT